MPSLHTNLFERGLLNGLDSGALERTWTVEALGADRGLAALARYDFNGSLGGESGFRQTWNDAFRFGADGPQNQGTGTNDTVLGNINTTAVLTIGGSQSGRINTPGDDDYYQVQLVAGQSYVFSLNASGADPLEDCFLELRNSSGQLISINDDSGPAYNSLLRFTATQTGTYYINVRAWEPDPGDGDPTLTGDYTVSAAIGAPQDPLDTIDYNWTVPTTTIEVYFATSGQTFGSGGAQATASRNWTQAEINAAMAALQTYSTFTNLTFVQTFNSANAEFKLVLTSLDPGVLGWFAPTLGVGAFSPTTSSWMASNSLTPGGSAFVTLIHEFGHGLGLAHPHDEGGVRDFNGDGSSEVMQGVTDPFLSYGTFNLNQGVFTTMTYNDGWATAPFGANSSLSTGSQGTPMALDIALMQQRYGVNTTYNNGSNTYTLTGAAGAFICIWDTGGNDTISYGGAVAATIDLRAATLLNEVGGGGWVSYVNNVHQGFTIANGVVIENAIGGSAGDTLIGNSANNRFTGNAGNDAINGGLGIDTSVYAIASTGVSWARNSQGNWIVITGASNGTDTLTSVEVLDFTDRDVVLDNAQQTFSGNGTSDFLWRNSDHGTVVVWEMQGAAQQSAIIAGGAPSNWTIVGTGDISGDGRDDMLWQNSVDGGVAGWLMDGATATQVAMVGGAPAVWQIVGMGDFNFDGKDDLVWRNTSDGAVAVWLMNGLSSHQDSIISGAPLQWSVAGIGDFDGDGRDDILLRHDDGTLARWTTNGVTQTGAAIVGGAPNEWQIAGVGDFDADGRADILWRNTSDGSASIWRMDGNTVLDTSIIGAAPADWSIAQVGDFTGDGRDDIVWRHNDGTLALWAMSGFTVLNTTIIGVVPTEWDLIG